MSQLQLRQQGVSWTDVDGEIVALDEDAAVYLSANGLTPTDAYVYAIENTSHRVSQFLHGEQGALVCTARIVETVPWIDAKYYASTQVMDEARHVEVFGRYLDEKMAMRYPMHAHLGALIDDVLSDSRWDITYLGMQIMIEGLALAAFGAMYQTTTEPLLRQLIRYVMSDEARHVAFGVLSLQEAYAGLSGAELRERHPPSPRYDLLDEQGPDHHNKEQRQHHRVFGNRLSPLAVHWAAEHIVIVCRFHE